MGVCKVRIQLHHATVVLFGSFRLSRPGVEIDEVQVRLHEIGVVCQGLFVLLDRLDDFVLEL